MQPHSQLSPSFDGFIDLDGARIHYLEWGLVDSPQIVILHDQGSCAQSWSGVAARLANSYRVLVPDLIGHGESDWLTSGDYSVAGYAIDLSILCRDKDIDQLILIGHGVGGQTAITFASGHPEQIRGTAVIGTNLVDVACCHKSPFVLAGSECEFSSPEIVVDWLRSVHPNEKDKTLFDYACHLTKKSGNNLVLKSDPRLFGGMVISDLWFDWKHLTSPTLIGRGRDSTVLDHESAVRMREANPRTVLAELEGGGDLFHMEIPDDFVDMILWFLGSVDI